MPEMDNLKFGMMVFCFLHKLFEFCDDLLVVFILSHFYFVKVGKCNVSPIIFTW